ncbi:efflux RND transporter periplasmic adaptor subunit [Maribacter sp. 2307ULW6-5]|uniref:efflux RND transporter periplasmic adaptor subunit n=1 Tax=Maribacter sp. 2307ULW6-5 TaxID=3386275 RepID=UPI0039BCC473
MKNTTLALITSLLLLSCGGADTSVSDLIASGDMDGIREKKKELAALQQATERDLRQLDSVIASTSEVANLPLVSTLTVERQLFKHYLELQGGVQTKQNVLVYPEMQGTLERIYVREGQRVSKGQRLASIDDGGMTSQLAQLRSQAELAQTTFERQKRLWDQNIGSEIQFLQAKTNYEAAKSAVAQIESQLDKSIIRAPFAGIVDNVIKDQGTVVAPGPGSEIFRIVNLSDMYIEVDVPETYLGAITKGKEALVYFPVLGDSVATSIRETGNFINPANRSFKVDIPVPNKGGLIKPNLTAKVNLNDYTSENALLIPSSIISENADGEQYIYVAEAPNGEQEAVAKRTVIETGKSQGAHIEVLAGLEEGQQVIKEGARTVKDGQQVKIIR